MKMGMGRVKPSIDDVYENTSLSFIQLTNFLYKDLFKICAEYIIFNNVGFVE